MRAGEKRGSQSEVVRVWGYIIKKKFQEWIQTSPIRQTCSKLVWCAGASAGAVCVCALPISGMGWTRIFWLRWDRRCCNLRIRLNCPGTSRDRTK